MGRQQIRCHGDESRFEVIAEFIYQHYGKNIQYIADVAGGQGLLSRILNKKYNYKAEVIDPRGFVLKGVPARQSEYSSDMAKFYDLIVGLHPDGATKEVVESAVWRPILLVPCCNEWDKTRKLGTKELVNALTEYLSSKDIPNETISFAFKGPKNVGILTN